jgi:positive regulator of sigma E activity
MNIEEGTVTKVTGDKAWVLVKQSTMCEGCHSKSTCHTLGGDRKMEAESYNTAGAATGDRVLLKINTKSLLRAAFLFYFFPAMALLGGGIAGMKLGPQYQIDPELAGFLSAIVAFVFSFTVILLIGKILKSNRERMPEVVKILSPESNSPDPKNSNECET